jgi:DivIVA domain-containing protein
MPEDRPVSITSSLRLAPDDVARHTFGSVRRGFDPNEVRAYLESVAVGLRTVAEREQELLKELADAEHRAAHPVLDEPTLTSALGTETARVLHSAHEVAAEMVANAEAEAARLLTETREEIDQHRATTEAALEERTTAAEAAAAELRDQTNEQVASALETTRNEAEELLSQAREQCRSMVDEAQGLRARVLSDLAKRRKVLHAQIEQLRAGRERLAETVQDVRRSIDVIADDLFAAEDNARLAAEAAGRDAAARTEDGSPEELASELLAEEAEVAAGRARMTEPPGGSGSLVEAGEDVVDVDGAVAPAVGGPDATIEGEGGGADPAKQPEVAGESVDALFAKLRAASSPKADGDTEATPGGGSPAGTASEGKPGPVGEAQADGEEDEGGPPDERDPLAVRRDQLIGPIVKALARRLKRTLQDNQNELLDALRSKGFHWSTDLLPDETEHLDSYATAALPALEQAAEAGVTFAGTGTSAAPGTDALLGIGHELAESVVGPLRRRLSGGEGLEDAEESVVADHVGSAFREWKGERIERLAGDHVVAAFSAATIAAAGGDKSTRLEWVAVSDTGDAPCPDCEDNGLNGSLLPGEEFPTGHLHPPAHPGCRCLLVVSAT